MNVILLEKVQNLGGMGEQVRVKAGFGRNFLIPQGKAVPATSENIQYFEERRAELEATAADKLSVANARADKLKELTIEISSKAGDEGKLYGSISTRDIATAISDAGVEVEKSEVKLPEGPLRMLGDYEIDIQLHPDVRVKAAITVVAAE